MPSTDMIVSIVLFLVILSLIHFFFSKISKELSTLNNTVKQLSDSLNNNIHEELSHILSEELISLGRESLEEQALWKYFNNKLSDIIAAYNAVKVSGVSLLFDNVFKCNFLGNGSTELTVLENMSEGVKFPVKFIDIIPTINEEDYEIMLTEVNKAIYKTDEVHFPTLKRITSTMFRRNVRRIYNLYLKEKYRANTGSENPMDLSIEEAKNLIKENKRLTLVFNFLYVYLTASDKDLLNTLAILQGQYYQYKDNALLGIEDSKVLIRIQKSLLEILDRIEETNT